MKSLSIFLILCICLAFLEGKTSKSSFLKLKQARDNSTYLTDEKKNKTEDEEMGFEPSIHAGNCFMKYHGWFYNLNKMMAHQKILETKTKDGKIIKFNICRDVETACPHKHGMVANVEDCILYSNTWEKDKTWEFKSDSKKEKETLLLSLPQGDRCQTGGNKTVIFEIHCDENATTVEIINEGEFNTEKCQNTIKMRSAYGCKQEKFKAWYKSFGVSKCVVGSILGLLGLFFLIFGKLYFNLTASVIIAFSTALMLKSLLSPFVTMHFVIALLLGIAIAYFSYGVVKLINTILAIIIGFIVGTITYNFIVKIFTSIDPDQLYLFTLIFFIGIFIFFAIFGDLIVVIVTSLIGSYFTIRGLSICLGGFPDETYTSRLIMYKEFNQLGRVFGGKANLYLMGILLLFVVGFVIQTSLFPQEKGKTEEHKEKEDEKKENVEDKKNEDDKDENQNLKEVPAN